MQNDKIKKNKTVFEICPVRTGGTCNDETNKLA